MSGLPHVRDPVTGRCIACEAMNNKVAVLDANFHPDMNSSKPGVGAGLLTPSGGARPVTPVVFDPADPNYIRAIRRGSVSLMKGQGVYTHGRAPVRADSFGGGSGGAGHPAGGGGGVHVVNMDGGVGGVQQYQPQYQPQYQLASRPSGRIEPLGNSPRTVVVQQGGPAHLHGANFYPGAVAASSGQGCGASCRSCCLSCCICCRGRRGAGGQQGGRAGGPKRPIWSYDEGDASGRCCKSCLVGFCILLVLLLLLAAILATVFSIEAVNQNTNLNRRYLLTYNTSLCQEQARLNATTLANCAVTQAPVIVNDATFTNPPVTFTAATTLTVTPSIALGAAALVGILTQACMT